MNISKNTNFIILGIVVGFVLLYFASVIIVERNLMYDDSYISFRYAKNLSDGYGLTWNIDEKPAEGYTNFLMVVVLAPFIKAGLDPLWVTRIISILCAFGISFLVGILTYKYFTNNKTIITLISIAYLPAGMTFYLCSVGLETILFTFLLFLAFVFLCYYFDEESEKYMYLSGTSLFLAFLTRPDGIILFLAFILIIFFYRFKEKTKLNHIFKPLLIVYLVPFIIYILFKLYYFGYLLPNSYYLKTKMNSLVTISGLEDTKDFFEMEKVLVIFAILTFSFVKNYKYQRLTALLFIILFSLFYTRVDTLSNIYNRFLYPVTPFIYFLALPLIFWIFRHLFAWNSNPYFKILVILSFFFLAFYASIYTPPLYKSIRTVRDVFKFTDNYEKPVNSLIKKRYKIANVLNSYYDTKNISIAYADAGVIPYYTNAKFIDVAGLNDNYIARETDLNKLVNYFFSKNPTVIIHPGLHDYKWLNFGDGHMGDYTKWSSDPRWNNYRYTGTINAADAYDLYFFVRKDYEHFDDLSNLIMHSIADTVYEKCPIKIGPE